LLLLLLLLLSLFLKPDSVSPTTMCNLFFWSWHGPFKFEIKGLLLQLLFLCVFFFEQLIANTENPPH